MLNQEPIGLPKDIAYSHLPRAEDITVPIGTRWSIVYTAHTQHFPMNYCVLLCITVYFCFFLIFLSQLSFLGAGSWWLALRPSITISSGEGSSLQSPLQSPPQSSTVTPSPNLQKNNNTPHITKSHQLSRQAKAFCSVWSLLSHCGDTGEILVGCETHGGLE